MATNMDDVTAVFARFNIRSVEDIIRLPDMKSVLMLMRKLGLTTTGIRRHQDAERVLLTYWREHIIQKRQRENGFKQALSDDIKNRRILSDKYDEVVEYYKKLPEQHRRDLDQFFKGIVETVKTKKGELASSDCAILVAGETSAGKSSFINLLLGKDLLPTSDLQCTTSICEIRYSQSGKKYAVLHHRSIDKQKRRPETIDLEHDKGIDVLSKVVIELDGETDESPYSRVEIFWPIDTLESGIVIVDTPGIGASRQLSKRVERFLSKSFGFIYIINSSNAGGIQKGRLKDFLRLVTTSVDEDFNPRATMFVCNKWDTVPESDQGDVYKNTIAQLKRCYPTVRLDQIFRLSTSEALKAMKYAGSTTTEHALILKGLERLLPSSLKNQIASHYGWISQVLKRSHYSLKVAKLMDAKGLEEKEQLQRRLMTQMDRLERDAKFTLDSMRKEVKEELESLHRQIVRLLSRTDILSNLCKRNVKECPSAENWKKVVKKAEDEISAKLVEEVNKYDDQNGLVKHLKDKIVKKFKRDFQIMEDQMRDVEVVLLPGDKRAVSDFHKSMKRPAPVKNVFQKAGKNQGGKPNDLKQIGNAVACAGSLNTKSKDIRGIFKSYSKRDPVKTMEDATILFIKSIIDGNLLRAKLDLFLSRYIKGIDDIAKMIPDLLKADRILMDTLKNEMKENKGLLSNIYPELLRDITKKQGQLDMFYIRCIMESDFRMRELEVDKSRSLGSGTFADVFMGTLKPPGEVATKVAVKINKETINAFNVSDLLLEDRTLRDLKHKNIVTYFGSVLSETEKSQIKWIMLLECCKGTLKDVFLEESFGNPGKLGNRRNEQLHAMRNMCRYVVELCHGLQYLHGKDLVHRDLKLENVLVSLDGTVKLTDVGLTKGAQMISGTIAGSPVYMAPEVLVTHDIYDHKADIYSLAIMLWEMWYGMDAAIHIQHYIHKSLQESVGGGLRPNMSIQHRPPDDWISVIERCWAKDPSARMEAAAVGSFFEKF
ncbi:tyrosine-protein kinase Fer-like isoform X2 [Pecten maximus]|uniref:tyrosine-protein kinase Fer-like isoform X2 n=1 Tax=Pecten maximus TaxID=6579 RepID=UPI001458BEF2|nr:tyrosine-protein kinase Fer-like isoform X2 [Pecten maximus]